MTTPNELRDWEKEFDEVFEEYSFQKPPLGGGFQDDVKFFIIRSLLTSHNQKLVEMAEGMKREKRKQDGSVNQEMFDIHDQGYNQGLQDIITKIKTTLPEGE